MHSHINHHHSQTLELYVYDTTMMKAHYCEEHIQVVMGETVPNLSWDWAVDKTKGSIQSDLLWPTSA